jgi:hypothetical protein
MFTKKRHARGGLYHSASGVQGSPPTPYVIESPKGNTLRGYRGSALARQLSTHAHERDNQKHALHLQVPGKEQAGAKQDQELHAA